MENHVREAYDNVQDANEQLQEAETYQKKAKNKYICIVILIVLVLAVIAGLLALFLWSYMSIIYMIFPTVSTTHRSASRMNQRKWYRVLRLVFLGI